MIGKLKRIASKVVGKAVGPMRPRLLRWAYKWPAVGHLYYWLTGSFRRELQAVLYGKRLHLQHLDQQSDEGAKYTLRRNVHRLEKGLIMRPRRSVFARDYIGETVELYVAVTGNGCADDGDRLLRNWAGDVLHQYFEAVGSDPAVDGARGVFQEAIDRLKQPAGTCAPYKRDLTPLRVTWEDMMALAKRRRSCRWYLQKPVERELIDKAIQVALYSPSACNRQPFEFRIFDDPQMIQQVAHLPMGTMGFADYFPCIVALVGRMRAFPYERDRHVIYIDASLSAMAFQFALEVQGLSSCCINWPDIPEREAKAAKLLKLEPDERIVMMISLGYPDPQGMVPYSQKKSLDEIRSYNRL